MGPVRELLRRATDDVHRALEADVDAIGRLSTEPERSRLAAGYGGFGRATGAALGPFIATLDAAGVALPGAPPAVSTDSEEPPLGSVSEALGYLYVVCGSALGGAVILKSLAERGCRTDDLTFLAEGPFAAPALWRSLLVALERHLPGESDRAAAVVGARRAFADARRHLCPAA